MGTPTRRRSCNSLTAVSEVEDSGLLEGKTLLLGAGGGPSTSAAVEVLRALQRAGAAVRVILSAETEAFVPALTFRSLAGGDVVMPGDLYGCLGAREFRSLRGLVEDADGLVVVPATPAFMAKAATGQADEALLRAILLHDGPTVFACPARAAEFRHPLVMQNVQRLQDAGVTLCDAGGPDGDRSRDELGWVLDPANVVQAVTHSLVRANVLTGTTVIVTAGPTQEPIDPVRHISNASSRQNGLRLG